MSGQRHTYPIGTQNLKRAFGLLVSASLVVGASAQLTVSPQTNLAQLARTITGPGVQISNPQITCHAEGYGEFAYTGSLIDIHEGVLLTSGKRTEAIGPNNVENKTFQQGTPGNAILNTVTGRTTLDACKLEFDIIPSGDSLRFNFVFGSEEYNEWVGSQYNDVFGFFISGPGITGDAGIGSDKNIALIPNTNQAVTINNVNNGSNSQYYFDNAGGQHFQYDGLTRGLYAQASVQPCQTYHLKLIVADASDRKFDSGVFIEKIRSNRVTMTSHTQSGGPDMVEGCNPGWVTFTRPTVTNQPLNLQYYLHGTATNGVDYTAIGSTNPNIPKQVIIPANQASVNVPVNPIADGLVEPTESLLFILGNPNCPSQALDTLIFNINDTLIANITPGTRSICRGDSIQYQITGGNTYSWSPANGLSSTSSASPWAKPLSQTLYTITISEGTCTRTMTRLLRVSNPVLSGIVTRPLCNGQTNGAINLTVNGGIAPFVFNWTGPNGFSANTEDLVNIGSGTYTVNMNDATGCARTQSFNVSAPAVLGTSLMPSIMPLGENIACFGGSTGSITSNITGGTAPYSSSWTGPNGFTSTSQNLTSRAAGAYAVTITDANGCTTSASYTLTQPPAIGPSISGVSHVQCAGTNNGQATVNISGGTPPFSYSWNTFPAQTTATVSGLAPGSYTATVTDGYSCASTANAVINGPTQVLQATVGTVSHVNCFGGNNGSATVAASGGTSPYSYSWNTNPAQVGPTATGLVSGTWTCTITDGNGCATSRAVTIDQPAAVLSSSITSQANVNCSGSPTGSATVAATGGTAPYGYSWNTAPVQSTATATNLVSGNWTCTITDTKGCTTTQLVTITQPGAVLSSSIGAQTNVNCFGSSTGSATVNVTGGTTPYAYSWNTSPVQSAATAINLSAGVRICMITDANGCSTTRSVTITQPSAALGSAASAQTNVSCFGNSTGSATVTATGGTSPYQFTWNTSPVQMGGTANNLGAGSYVCTISDANNCSTTRSISISQPSASLSTSISAQTNVLCSGNSSGAASVSATGGTAPYSYSWNTLPAQNTASATGLPAGTWNCTVTDASGCSATRSVTITQPSAPLSSAPGSVTHVSCFGNSTGGAMVSASGGTAPYAYSWNTVPVQTTATASNLGAGTRICTITDANGCTTTRTVTITQPASALAANLSGQMNISCSGNSTGSATVSASGGTGPYTYSWNTVPVQNTFTATNLVAGTWTCTVTDNLGCSATRNAVITQPSTSLTSSLSAQTNVLCFGSATGNATVAATGGTSPYAYSWNSSPAQTTATASNLLAGTWTCTVTDANGCASSRTATISQPASALSSSIASQTNVSCFGNSTGSATVSVAGGTVPYSYSWNTTPVQTTSTATNLAAGPRVCTITDANGCSITRSVTIIQPAGAVAVTGSVTAATCGGASNGAVDATISGGIGPYSATWSGPGGFTSSSVDISGLGSGVYALSVTDANGCTASNSFNVGQPGLFTITASISDFNGFAVSCSGTSDGSIDQTISGGTSPYIYNWSGPDGFAAGSEDITSLAPGDYTFIVTDQNGCATSASYSLTAANEMTADLSTPQLNGGWNIACAGQATGSIDAVIAGGVAPVSLSWSGPNGFNSTSEDPNSLLAGTYSLTMTDASGCVASDGITLTEPVVLSAVGSVIADVDCFGNSTGLARSDVNGGTAPYSYAWNTVPAQFTSNATDLPAGAWDCVITDANGCTTTTSSLIAGPASGLSVSITSSTNVLCHGAVTGDANASASGGTAPHSFTWDTAPAQTTANATSLGAGDYNVAVSDANGCVSSEAVTIDEPAEALDVFVDEVTPVSCFGAEDGAATVTISGGSGSYTISWNTSPVANGPSISNLAPGPYTVIVADNNGCSQNKEHTVNVMGAASLFEMTMDIRPISCNGSDDASIDLSLNGGQGPYSHTWSDGTLTTGIEDLVDLGPGTYSLITTDAYGCSYDTTVTFTEPTLISFTGAITPATCLGMASGEVDATVQGGTNAYTFSWTGPNGYTSTTEDVTGLDAGNYALVVSDANGCTSAGLFDVDQPGSLDLALVPTVYNGAHGVTCSGATDGSIDLEVTGGTAPYSIAWTGPNGFSSSGEDLTGLGAGAYSVSVEDANGCVSNGSVTLSNADPLLLQTELGTFANGLNITCSGATDGAVDLTVSGGTGPFTYAWSDGAGYTANTEDVTGLSAGVYQVTVTDANGCALSEMVTLNGPIPLDVSATLSAFNGSNIPCNGAGGGQVDLHLAGGSSPYTIDWSNGVTTEDLIDVGVGTYSVSVTDITGCIATASYTLAAPAPLDVAITTSSYSGAVNVSCPGGSDGSIDVVANGGTPAYATTWIGPNGFTANTLSISDLIAGTYQLTLTDANGCSVSSTTTLLEPAPLDVQLASTTYNGGYNLPCADVQFSNLDALVSGGTLSYTYDWTGPNGYSNTLAELDTLAAGTYSLVVTDGNGCSAIASYNITAPDPLELSLDLSDFDGFQVSCTGNDGSVDLSVTGGTPGFIFDWTGSNGYGGQDEDPNGLAAGIYALVISDANGCKLDTTFILAAPEPLQAGFETTPNACASASTGAIDLSITGGGAPYMFAWSGPAAFTSTDEDIAGLVNGTYVVTVSDGLGCGNTFSTTLNGPTAITSGTYVSFYGTYNLQCAGDSTGVIELLPQGGTMPITTTISGPNGFTSTNLQNTQLAAGSYAITFTDANGCVLDTTVTLTQPATGVQADLTLSLYPSGTNVSCYGASDGGIDATITGGTGPYIFSWRGPDSLEFSTEDLVGLPAGDYVYELVVTDANQCSFFTTVTLTQPDTVLIANAVLSVFNGGYNTTCETASDGRIELSVAGGNGGFQYVWSGPNGFSSTAPDISGLIGGTYTVDITDINGCTLQEGVVVSAPALIAPGMDAFMYSGGTMISCFGMQDGAITASITGGASPYVLSWTGPNGYTSSNASIADLAAGTYCVSVTDANGCGGNECLEIAAPALLAATTSTSPAACSANNGAVDLTVSGGTAPYTFDWNNGTTDEDLTGLEPGPYAVTVIDANGCTASSEAIVLGTSAIAANGVPTAAACFGSAEGAIDLQVSSGTQPFTFAWSNGSTSEDLVGVPAGSYTVGISDAAGCTFTGSWMVTGNAAIAIDTILSTYAGGYNISAPGANDGSIITAVSGGTAPYVFAWSNGASTESISGLPGGTYSLVVTDAIGCTATLELVLTVGNQFQVPTAFSPNGDGDNDAFVIHGIENYPKNMFTVLNRWGNVVYEQPNYKNQWVGDNRQGEQLPNGTYFIILTINNGDHALQGYVDLRR